MYFMTVHNKKAPGKPNAEKAEHHLIKVIKIK